MVNTIGILYLIMLFLIRCKCDGKCQRLISESINDNNMKELKSCCNEITISLYSKEICLNRPNNETGLLEEMGNKSEFIAFNSECSQILKKSDSDDVNSWKNHENFEYCKEMNFTDRKLQIKSGFGSHIRLPQSTSSLRGPQDTPQGNIFKYQTQKICVSVLSLHYIKVCEKLCDAETALTVEEEVFPRSCFPICVDFANHVCIRGCSFFGCNIPFDACSYQMCNFKLT
ncbi:Uncharacterized protein cpbgf_2003060 [Cryptosporidium parvum]|nr:Uncharacterized protein CPATCC_0027730 [Cryptosporidium parvum]WRK31096.1 Uncharacterized protein cpbgf_2003060 [Cryptosporidium parvum]|eukprot:QOY42924.1 hypothetical protein CPATCC_000613 [Cryptosporidium parvum]